MGNFVKRLLGECRIGSRDERGKEELPNRELVRIYSFPSGGELLRVQNFVTFLHRFLRLNSILRGRLLQT
jgi:hypothetical protein